MRTVRELADEVAQNKTVEAVEAFLKHIAEQLALIKPQVMTGAPVHATVQHIDSLVAQIDAARGANADQAAQDEGELASQRELPLDQQTGEPIDPRAGAMPYVTGDMLNKIEAPAEDPPAAEEEPLNADEVYVDAQPEETLA